MELNKGSIDNNDCSSVSAISLLPGNNAIVKDGGLRENASCKHTAGEKLKEDY